MRKRTDFESGKGMGRIWRVGGRGPKAQVQSSKFKVQSPKSGSANAAELVAALEHPNGWHRDTAFRLLVERRDTNLVPLLLAKLPKASLGDEPWKHGPSRAVHDPKFGPHLADINTLNALVVLTDWCKIASEVDKRSRDQPGPEIEKIFVHLLSSTFAESPGVRETAWRWLGETRQ